MATSDESVKPLGSAAVLPGILPEAVRDELERVAGSRGFSKAPQLRRLLCWLVEESLEGRAGALREHELGIAVFERGSRFDPKADPVVRLEVRRLRAKLLEYYSGEGAQDPIVIQIPKGRYVPVFQPRAAAAPDAATPDASAMTPLKRGNRRRVVIAGLAILAVAAGVGVHLFRVRARHVVPPLAQHLYAEGRGLAARRTIADLDRSVELFQNAVALDPGYAAAWAGLASSYLVSATNRELPDPVRVDRARDAAAKALALHANQAEAHAILGLIHFLYDWDFPAATKELDHALRLDPRNPQTLHWHSETLFAVARNEEGWAEVRRALEIEPDSLALNSYAGFILYALGRYDEAISQLQKTVAMKSYWKLHRNLGWAYEQKGLDRQALAEHRLAVEESGRLPEALAGLAEALARAGRRTEARAMLAELQGAPGERLLSPYEVAAVQVSLGDYDRAMDNLERAYHERSSYLLMLFGDARFYAVRGQPRVRAILSGIGIKLAPEAK